MKSTFDAFRWSNRRTGESLGLRLLVLARLFFILFPVRAAAQEGTILGTVTDTPAELSAIFVRPSASIRRSRTRITISGGFCVP